MIRLKRAYERPSPRDGWRILVERLWPRGVSKAKAKIDFWLKDVAPSPGLRTWYGHDPARWPEFRKRYSNELKKHVSVLSLLKFAANKMPITFVYAAHDTERNSALVLREYLEGM